MTGRFEVSGITDTAEYDLPDLDTQGPFERGKERDRCAVFVTNNGDTPLTARLERATNDDDAFEEAAVDVGGVPVLAGETVVIRADPEVPMGLFRTVVSFDSAPTDGSVVADYQLPNRH